MWPIQLNQSEYPLIKLFVSLPFSRLYFVFLDRLGLEFTRTGMERPTGMEASDASAPFIKK
jgi:hypothetical protein